ncbi:MAG: lipid A biosynthesis acyltransferase [Vicingaceae bacterium]|nr:lipid A biosynthesis acyltransferase [Vicingaceae bacterium]
MGSRILYYLVILPISYLPFFLLYCLSDFAFFMMYHVIGYRKKIVLMNIKNSFPEKTEQEHKKIAKEFYKHFCDLILEGLKGFTISEKQINKRFKIHREGIIDELYKKGKDIVFVGGHYNNWEILALGIGMQLDHTTVGIYKPLSNKFFNDKMKNSRERFGLILAPMKQVKKFMSQDYGNPKGVIFAIDQSPHKVKTAYWTEFLNQDTAMFYGAEKYAKEFNVPVVYCVINKVKRGVYEATSRLVTDAPNTMEFGEIIKTANQFLEEDIKKEPQYWLWTHRRWKHKRDKTE